MTSSIDVIQYPGNGIHAEEIDVENKSTSSGLSDHPRDKNYVSSSLSGSVTIVEEEKDKSKRKKSKSRGFRHILKREEKDTVTEKPDSKQRSNEEKKSESLARTLSGMFSHKSKSEKEKRKEVVDNKNRIIPKQTNDGNEMKSKNRRSLIFFSDNEDEATDHAKRGKRLNSNDSPFSDNESSSNKLKNVRKNRISLNIDKLLGLDDDHKHKNFNNNNITDLFLPETNGSPIKTYKGRLDSSGSVGGRDSPVSILKRAVAVPNQTESPISHTTTFTPSVSIINESTPDHSQETKIESVESVELKDEINVESVEQKDEIKVEAVELKNEINIEPVEQNDETNIEPVEQKDETKTEPVEQKDETKTEPVEQKDEIKIEPVEQKEIDIEPVEQNEDFKIDPVEQNEEFKDDLYYSSTPATSINEDLPINEQELKLVSQVSSDSLNAEVSRERSYYQVNKDICNNTDIEISNDIKDPIDDEIINDNLKVKGYTNLSLHDSDQGAKSIATTANSHEDEHLSSTYSSGSSVVSDFLISNINTDSEIQKSLNHDVEHNNLEEDDVKYEQVYHIENKILKTSQIISPIPQITEKQVIITQENPQIQKLEELQAANESLNNAKIQLESKIQEQSQQIAKLTSLESINESLVNAKTQLESKVQEQSEQIAKLTFGSANEPLNNDKDQLESKVQEQSQQIAKLTSLESVMVRQFELAERMEETMRRLEAKVNNQKEELDGLLTGRMEDTIRQLEYKLNEQNKEVEGLKSVVGEFQKTHPQQILIAAEPTFDTQLAQLSVTSSPEERTLAQTSSPSMMTASITMTEQQAYTKDTLVNTLVVKPLVNTITVSASIATSVLYAVYVRPVVGLVKVVRHGL